MAHLAARAYFSSDARFASVASPLLPATGRLQRHLLPSWLPAGYAVLQRQQLRTTTCSASGGAGAGVPPPRRGRSSSGPASSSSSRAASSAAGGPDDLQRIKGVGPANEELLKKSKILRVQDLQSLYQQNCLRDVERLAEYLQSEVGIRRLHGKLIAQEISELVAEAEKAAEAEAAAASAMVTLAVEGNISAGKSTFLDVLSHEETNLRDILKVVQEPVSDWQRFDCRDRNGQEVTTNVLEKFYSDPNRYAYSFQHYVLMSRMKKDRATRTPDKDLRVVERSIFSDRQVFVRAMHKTGTMEDFEVSVYNDIFKQEVDSDFKLVPDGFVYLRAAPQICMQRMRRRNRGEEGGLSQDYLEMLHANHEDWLHLNGDSPSALLRDHAYASAAAASAGNHPSAAGYASVLAPSTEAAAQELRRLQTAGRELDSWKLELIKGVPHKIKDQVLLLKEAEGLPQLQDRLVLVMDHDEDIDVHNDTSARREYAEKIQEFYAFVKLWKSAENAAMEAIRAGVRDGSLAVQDGKVILPNSSQMAHCY